MKSIYETITKRWNGLEWYTGSPVEFEKCLMMRTSFHLKAKDDVWYIRERASERSKK